MSKKTGTKKSKKRTTNGKILIFALSALALALIIKVMQEHYTQQQYAQDAQITCTPPPPCMIGPRPSCYIAEQGIKWCALPTITTPSPTPFAGFSCSDCRSLGAGYFCINTQTNQQYCLRFPIKAKGFVCNVCKAPQVSCIPRPSCADDKMHPCIVGPQFCLQ